MAVQKKNIFLKNTIEPLPYAGQGKPGPQASIPNRENPVAHGVVLTRKFAEAYEQNKNLNADQVAAIRYKNGVYLEFSGQVNHDLVVKSLENVSTGIRLLNVQPRSEDGVIKATIYVPEGKEAYFINRFEKYLTVAHEHGKLPNKDLINSIENIRLAMLDSFWVGKRESMPSRTPVWCEIWLRTDDNSIDSIEEAFEDSCRQLEIECDEKSIRFPERMVKLVRSNATKLGELIKINEYIAEMRRAEEPVSFFEELPPIEQKEWTQELLSRIVNNRTNTSICLLDTGLNSGHPLIEPFCEDECIQTVDNTWGNHDHDGHGTEMAGIALFSDLREKLLSRVAESISHSIESVKILPPRGENDQELYGAITHNAVYMAETVKPNNARVICMAVTEKHEHNINDGRPSSWSGSIDALISGAVGDNSRRLFFISAGNVQPSSLVDGYPDINLISTVQSPGQAWNAITVGAYSNEVHIIDPSYREYSPVADSGELSPYSSTSLSWDKKWPIKPEILCDGGNVASDGVHFSECTDLSLLTTNHQPLTRLFSTIWGTSSATAQASLIAAKIMAEYPNIWPETVRSLIIHSARWTDKMKYQFCTDDKKTAGRRTLLRTCGYGIPNLNRAIECLNNHVNMIIEGELQPFAKDKKMNEMHLHKIPWPKSVLQGLENTPVEMRVTLSYFIEPGPGEIGWKDKYRYPSCGLRFDVINSDETKDDFLKRINAKMRGEDRSDHGEGSSGSENWYLGSDNRDVGSIHSDFRLQSAVDLCDANYISVYPVIGWWRERTYLKCFSQKIRYSLIVSIYTPESTIDLYTPIVTQIEITTQNTVEIQI